MNCFFSEKKKIACFFASNWLILFFFNFFIFLYLTLFDFISLFYFVLSFSFFFFLSLSFFQLNSWLFQWFEFFHETTKFVLFSQSNFESNLIKIDKLFQNQQKLTMNLNKLNKKRKIFNFFHNFHFRIQLDYWKDLRLKDR